MFLSLMMHWRISVRSCLWFLILSAPVQAAPDLPSELNAATEAVARGEYATAEASLLALDKRLTPESRRRSLTEGTILLKLADVYTAQGRLTDLTAVLQRAIEIYQSLPEQDHNLSVALNNLGAVYERLGNSADANRMYSRALQVREAALGPDSPELAPVLNNLGNIERTQGLRGAAERHLQRALVLARQLPKSERTRARILSNLGLLYRAEGRYPEAAESYRQALALEQQAGPSLETNRGTTLNNLGDLLNAQGKPREAEPVLTEALALQQQRFGAASVEVASVLNNLGMVSTALGRSTEAQSRLEQSIGILEAKFGPDYLGFGPMLSNLGRLYLARGETRKAEPLLNRAVQVFEKVNGPDGLEVVGPLINLAMLKASQKRFNEADDLNVRCLRALSKHADSTDPLMGAVLNTMGFVSFGRHQYPVAEGQFLKAIEIGRKSTPSPDAYCNLARVYMVEKRYENAKRYYGEAIRLWDADSATFNPAFATTLENYAKLLRKMEDFAGAEEAETRALGIRVRNSLRN